VAALIDITQSLCLAVASGNLGEAQAIAREVSRRLPARRVEPSLNPAAVMSVVCDHFGVSASDMRGPHRHQRVSHPRAVAIYMMRQLTDLSFVRIGAFFGGRDHTTAIQSWQKVQRWLEADPLLAEDVATIRRRLGVVESKRAA
jgi:chromosomal replication initiator protein